MGDRPNRCPVCGATGVPLEQVHIVPISGEGSKGPENLMLLCANCHAQMDRGQIREFEFQATLFQLMRLSKKFDEKSLVEEAKLGLGKDSARVDIAATEKDGGRKLLIECKSSSALNPRRLREIATDLQRYKILDPNATIVLAVPSRTSPSIRTSISQRGLELWDLDEIARRFRPHLREVLHPVLRPMLLGVAALRDDTNRPTAEASLATELNDIPSGREAWKEYQRLVTRILERLFVPPLAPPISEASDGEGRNRRDIILPNYSESGFWAFMRGRYAADFIVADAKNSGEEIGKDEALQMLHYLKEDGAGLFGLLISRKGMSEACQHALGNHWIRHGKMVICLSDEDVLQMLRLKEGGGAPETVIRQAIEDFRLSL